MKSYSFYLVVRVDVESELNHEEALDQFISETDYNFGNTDDVIIQNTEICGTQEDML